jgi:hypothetical protein
MPGRPALSLSPIAGTYFENDTPFELARLLGNRDAFAVGEFPGLELQPKIRNV